MGKNNGSSGIATEHFRANFQLDPDKSNLEEREFSGMASVFGSLVDAYQPTIIEPGAFGKTLVERNGEIPILWQHDQGEPIGMPSVLEETPTGLFIKGKLSQTDVGDKAVTLMRDGALRGLSIGFDPVKWEMEKEKETDSEWDATRHIKELRLWEVSLVTFGADPLAKIREVRSQQKQKGAKDIADALDSILSALNPEIEPHPTEALTEPLPAGALITAFSKEQLQRIRKTIDVLQKLLDAAEPPATALTVEEVEDFELELMAAEARLA